MKLFKALLLLMLVASVVPTVMVGLLAVSEMREMLIRDAQELSVERVKVVRVKAEAVLEEPTRAALGLARIPGFFSLGLGEQRSHLAAVLNQRRDITALTVFDARGERLPGLQAFAVKDVPPTEVAEHEQRAKALLAELSDGPRYSEVYRGQATHAPGVTVAFAVGNPVRGYVAAELSLDGLREVLLQEKVGSSGFAYVTDRAGRLVSGPLLPGTRTGLDVSGRPAVQDLLQTLHDSRDSKLLGELFHVGNFGTGASRVVGAYMMLPEPGWAVVSEEPMDFAYAQVRTMERKVLLGVFAALVVALALAALFSRNVTRPLKGFMAAALKIAQGQFGTRFELKSKNELGELAQTFNYMSQQLLAYDAETRGLYSSLEEGYLETIVALANSIDSKDAYTRGHSQRVADTAVDIGRELGLHERELKHLRYGGILHDIGKIGIVESILVKQSRLTDEEMTVMREHPVIGDQIVEPISFLRSVRAAVRSHHERWDGNGYPDKLAGEAIPLIARIVACADTFDACTSTRPYSKAMPLPDALEVMAKLRGNQHDAKVVDALRRVVEKKGVTVEGHRGPVKLAS